MKKELGIWFTFAKGGSWIRWDRRVVMGGGGGNSVNPFLASCYEILSCFFRSHHLCNYHLAKVNQPFYRKIIEIHNMDRNQLITTYRRDLLNPLRKGLFPERYARVNAVKFSTWGSFSSPEPLGLICKTTWPRNDLLWGRECLRSWCYCNAHALR